MRRVAISLAVAIVIGVALYGLMRGALLWYMQRELGSAVFATSAAPAVLWPVALALGLVAGWMTFRAWAPKFDAFLFAAYDRSVMLPVGRGTGMLGFCLPAQGEQRRAWDALHAFALSGQAQQGVRAVPRSAAEEPFAWTALLGPSGVGKSQLCRELGRYLAQRARYGDAAVDGERGLRLSRARLHVLRWLRRVLPFCSTQTDPFDVGLLAYDQLEGAAGDRTLALQRFRPRAPTLWILDAPGLGVVRQVTAIVKQQVQHYRHPVRLIVIDREIAVDWPLNPRLDGSFAFSDTGAQFDPVCLTAAGFDFKQFAVAARTRWDRRPGTRPVLRSNQGLPVVQDPNQLATMFGVLGGSPLRLSLAIHWLAADRERTLARLLEMGSVSEGRARGRRPSAHRRAELIEAGLAMELARSLQVAYRKLEGPASAGGLGCAMASATLSGGLPLTKAVRTLFAVAATRDRVRDVARYHPAEPVSVLPAIEPSVVAEAFLQLTRESEFSRSPDLFLTQVVHCALTTHPASALKAVVRGGRVGQAVAEVALTLPTPELPALHVAHFTAAMIVGLRGDEPMLTRALALASTLPESRLGAAISSLERARACHREADPLSAGAIYCALCSRIMRSEQLQEAVYANMLSWLRRWLLGLAGNEVLRRSSERTRKLLLDEFAQFVAACLWRAGRTPETAFSLLMALDEEVVSRVPAPLLQQANAVLTEQPRQASIAVTLAAWAGLWRVRVEAAAGRLHSTDHALRALSRDIGESHLPMRQTVVLRMKAQLAWIALLNRMQASARVEAGVAEVAVMAELFAAAPLAFPELTLERARALEALSLARRTGGRPAEAVAEVAQEVESLVSGFASDSPAFCELMLTLARARCHAAAVHARVPELRARTIDFVEGVVRIAAYVSKGHPLYPELILVATEAWTHACVTRQEPESYWAFVGEASRSVARMLAPFAHAPLAYPQLLTQWAQMFVQMPTLSPGAANVGCLSAVEQYAKQVESILAPFIRRPLVFPEAVTCCAAAQGQIVAVRAAAQPESEELDAAVARVLAYLQPFTAQSADHSPVRLIGVRALRQLVEARAQLPEQCAGIEPAVTQIGRMVTEASESPVVDAQLAAEWASAGASLAFVGSQQESGTRMAEQGARVVQRAIERLGGLSMAPEALVCLWADALQWVAVACSREPGQRGHALQAAQQIDRIVSTRMRGAREAYLLPRARAWAAVAAARRWISEQRLRTEDAAWKVEALAEPKSAAWESHTELMQLWARAWGEVAWACAAMPDQSARAGKAAARMRYVVTEFARDCYQELLDVERMLSALKGHAEGRLVRSSGVVARDTLFGGEEQQVDSDIVMRGRSRVRGAG